MNLKLSGISSVRLKVISIVLSLAGLGILLIGVPARHVLFPHIGEAGTLSLVAIALGFTVASLLLKYQAYQQDKNLRRR